jgi:hypothetical protein
VEVSRLRVVCTGNGSHGAITATELDVAGDGTVTEVLVRRGRSSIRGQGSVTIDGRDLPVNMKPRMTVTSEPVIAPNGTLHWRCPKCGRDRPVNGEHLRRWVALEISLGRAALDVSTLPR